MATTPTSVVTPISLRAKLEILAAIAILICAAIAVRTRWAEHDARVKAEASVAAAQKNIDQATTSIKQLQDQDKLRSAQTADAIAKLAAAAAAQKTPQQITRWLPSQAGSLPAPITSSIAPATAQNPTPAAVFDVPQADLPALRDQVAKCQANGQLLSNAQAGLSSCQSQLKLAGEQLSAAEKQRDDYKQALKGGTFWQRIKGGTEKVAIGVGIGVAVTCGSGHCK
jgi:flagellar biosynthesis chaperone FliJ